MSQKRGRKAEPSSAEAEGKSSKKAEPTAPEEELLVGDVDAFAAELADKGGPELLVYLRKALNSPDLFTFGELLDAPCVHALRDASDAEAKRTHNLLVLFAFNTYSNYRANRAVYGPLTEAQVRKLRMLSVVSLCARSRRVSYDDLKEELDIFDVRELEDFLMDAIYAGLLGGKLDSKNQALFVEFSVSRDIRPQDLERMREVLQEWQSRAGSLVELIREKVDVVRGEMQQNEMLRGEHRKRVKEMTEQIAEMQLKHDGDERRGRGHDTGGLLGFGGGGGGGRRGGGGGGGGFGARRREGRKRLERDISFE